MGEERVEGSAATGPKGALTEEMQDIAMVAPIPMVVHQDWIIRWSNRQADLILARLGYVNGDGSVLGLNVLNLLAPAEHGAATENRARILDNAGEPSPPLYRTFVGADGRAHKVLGSGIGIVWEGEPAVLVSLAYVGEVPAVVAELGRHAHNVPPGEVLSSNRERLSPLTPRELEVAMKLTEGFTPANAASILGTTEHTVRTQIKSIYKKLEITGRTELVRLVVGAGLGDL